MDMRPSHWTAASVTTSLRGIGMGGALPPLGWVPFIKLSLLYFRCGLSLRAASGSHSQNNWVRAVLAENAPHLLHPTRSPDRYSTWPLALAGGTSPERGNGALGTTASARDGGVPFHARFTPREVAAPTAPLTAS